jgi:hypothetical protein
MEISPSMIDPTNHTKRWEMPRVSIWPVLSIILSLSLIFFAYHLILQNVTAQSFSPAAPSTGYEPPASVEPAAATAATAASADVETLMAQLTANQSQLQHLASQLEQKGQVTGDTASASSGQSRAVYEDIPALWAEIEQLYQIMQLLMAQVDAASTSPSTRSASEMIALRTQVNTIHQRLTHLLARVETAQARSSALVSNAVGPAPAQPEIVHGAPDAGQAMQQLYLNMVEMNRRLQQLQSQNADP